MVRQGKQCVAVRVGWPKSETSEKGQGVLGAPRRVQPLLGERPKGSCLLSTYRFQPVGRMRRALCCAKKSRGQRPGSGGKTAADLLTGFKFLIRKGV